LVLVVVGVLAVRQDIRTRRDAQTLRFALGLFEQMVTARHETFGPQERAVFPSRLVQMSEDVQSQLSDRPVLQASVLASIAKCLAFTYGRYAEAEPILRRALALIEANSDNPRQRRRMLYTWTIIAAEVGVLKDPAKTYRSLIAEADREGENDEQVMRVLITLTWALLQSEQAETAQQALGDLRRHLATQPEALQAKLAEQVVAIEAYSLLLAHHPEQAERLLPGCDALLKGPGPDREHWYQLVQSQAMIQGAMGRRSRARELWECLLVETQRCQGAGSRQVMTARRNIAGLAWLDRDLVTAERMFGELAASAQATQPPDNKTLAEALNSRGVCLRDMARYDEAEPLLKEALRQRIKMMGGESPRVAETRINLATLYLRSGRAADALREADEAYLLNKNLSGENHHNSIESLAVVGMARSALAGPAAGLADLTEAYRRRVDGGLMADWRTDVAVDALVGALESVGRAADALALLEKEYTALHDSLGEHNAITLRASARLQKRKQLSATETVAP
jgi:tetratricopeptide (TPR) repeat protein